jgi:hypothetical protein
VPDITHDLVVTKNGTTGSRNTNATESWAMQPCARCGTTTQMLVVAETWPDNNQSDTYAPKVHWLRCIQCNYGAVKNDRTLSPGIAPFAAPKHLPESVEGAWEETRMCLSVGASTATAMMCRKILFHIAVNFGMAEKNNSGYAPNFKEVLKYLREKELYTSHMVPWVERIRDIGNDANHEISAITQEQATDIARFTHRLLELAYELPAEAQSPVP